MMVLLKQLLQKALGEKIYYDLGYHYLRRSHPAFKESIARLGSMRDHHRGERCFILGNGPSLNQMDLSPLKGEITFGLNRICLLFPKTGFATTYLVAINKLVIEQFGNELIQSARIPKFISYDARRWIKPDANTIFLYSRNGPYFYKDISRGIWQGATVTYAAMQIAYHMGFHQVILIGVDHNFTAAGAPHQTVTSDHDDRNHFDPNYFGKGVRWQLPDLELSEAAYRLARNAYLADQREIVDATIGGKLQVFPKVDYGSLF